jgi:hypothetical protein
MRHLCLRHRSLSTPGGIRLGVPGSARPARLSGRMVPCVREPRRVAGRATRFRRPPPYFLDDGSSRRAPLPGPFSATLNQLSFHREVWEAERSIGEGLVAAP